MAQKKRTREEIQKDIADFRKVQKEEVTSAKFTANPHDAYKHWAKANRAVAEIKRLEKELRSL